jgi:uncharacterized RDD family membrane protein YckC
MGETIRILTPEQVELDYEVAGIGSRFIAGLLDVLLQAGLIFAGYIVALIFGVGAIFTGSPLDSSLPASVVTALLLLYVFGVFWGYFIYFETRWNGQTPGKRTLGLRVICDSGHPIDFRTAFIRNIVRLVDMLPGVYAIGLITMFVSSHWKRLGDHAAGTIVVKERKTAVEIPSPGKLTSVSWDSKDFPILNDQALGRISTLRREDYETIRRFFERRLEFDLLTQGRLAREIAAPLLRQLGIDLPYLTKDKDYERFLEEVARAYEHLRGH